RTALPIRNASTNAIWPCAATSAASRTPVPRPERGCHAPRADPPSALLALAHGRERQTLGVELAIQCQHLEGRIQLEALRTDPRREVPIQRLPTAPLQGLTFQIALHRVLEDALGHLQVRD